MCRSVDVIKSLGVYSLVFGSIWSVWFFVKPLNIRGGRLSMMRENAMLEESSH